MIDSMYDHKLDAAVRRDAEIEAEARRAMNQWTDEETKDRLHDHFEVSGTESRLLGCLTEAISPDASVRAAALQRLRAEINTALFDVACVEAELELTHDR